MYKRESVIIFDEIQLMPKVRQAIKYLVADGKYDYIETSSLISIKKNVKDIVLPSEEMKIQIYPMDYEELITEFQKKYSKHVSKEILLSQKDIGNSEMLKLYPIYMLPFYLKTYERMRASKT